jgi:hypothetical protein
MATNFSEMTGYHDARAEPDRYAFPQGSLL